MSDAQAEAELPGENTAMLRPRDDEVTDFAPVKASAPAVSEVPTVELPRLSEGGDADQTPVPPPSESEVPPVELPVNAQEPSFTPEQPVVQTEELPDAGIREFFLDADWQPPADFGELPELPEAEADDTPQHDWNMFQDTIDQLDQGGGW